ncbi:MAG: hypothetical protein ACK47B_28995 [Armatimonadota bacterium]
MKRFLLTLLPAALLCLAVPSEARPRFGRVQGTISAVSVVPATVTITPAAGADVVLNVSTSTKVIADDERGSLADLVVGADARAKYELRTGNALQIHLDEPDTEVEATGVVTAASFDELTGTGQVSIDTNNDPTIAELNLTVDSATELRLGRLPLATEDVGLLVGLTVETEYDNVTFVAQKIHAELEDADVLSATGTVESVDSVEGTLTVNVNGESVLFDLADGAEVKLRGRIVPLSTLEGADQVTVQFIQAGDPVVNLALQVVASGQTSRPQNVNGTLVAVDPLAGTLTIQPKRGESVVLTVSTGTDLRIRGRRVDLAAFATALADAEAAGKTVKVNGQYVARSGANAALRVHATVQKGRGGNGNGNGRGNGRG